MRYIIITLAVIFLSSCALFPKNVEDLACPQIGFIPNSDRVYVGDVKVSMDGFSGSCSLEGDNGLQVDLIIPFKTERKYLEGEHDFSDLSTVELPYFIAILRPDETILKKTIFSTKFDFNNLSRKMKNEEHNIVLPLASFKEGYRYKITMGFILTKQQLRRNKEK